MINIGHSVLSRNRIIKPRMFDFIECQQIKIKSKAHDTTNRRYESSTISSITCQWTFPSHSFGAKSFKENFLPFITLPRSTSSSFRQSFSSMEKVFLSRHFRKRAALENLKLTQFTSHVNFARQTVALHDRFHHRGGTRVGWRRRQRFYWQFAFLTIYNTSLSPVLASECSRLKLTLNARSLSTLLNWCEVWRMFFAFAIVCSEEREMFTKWCKSFEAWWKRSH